MRAGKRCESSEKGMPKVTSLPPRRTNWFSLACDRASTTPIELKKITSLRHNSSIEARSRFSTVGV
ncbi:hypothetical protein D3C72_2574810 [compost metagenome]